MAIVVDANLLIVLINGDPRGETVLVQMTDWIDRNVPLHAPSLASYESCKCFNTLPCRRHLRSELEAAWDLFSSLPITYHPGIQGVRTIEIALSLGRQNAYDAAYLALAETLNAELWTLDSPLYRNAIAKGLAVKLLQT